MVNTPFTLTKFHYGLLLLALLACSGWQWLQITQLGQHWQSMPQRALIAPLADYAQQQAVVALTTQARQRQQQIVDELVAGELVAAAQLYDNSGLLLAHSGERANNHPPYIRALYHQSEQAPTEQEPIGFLRLHLAQTNMMITQRTVWQQLLHHLQWLLPLTVLGGFLLGHRLNIGPQK